MYKSLRIHLGVEGTSGRPLVQGFPRLNCIYDEGVAKKGRECIFYHIRMPIHHMFTTVVVVSVTGIIVNSQRGDLIV